MQFHPKLLYIKLTKNHRNVLKNIFFLSLVLFLLHIALYFQLVQSFPFTSTLNLDSPCKLSFHVICLHQISFHTRFQLIIIIVINLHNRMSPSLPFHVIIDLYGLIGWPSKAVSSLYAHPIDAVRLLVCSVTRWQTHRLIYNRDTYPP